MTAAASDELLARTLREESGLLVARLSRRYGDFDLAEEAVQVAVVEALTRWRRDGPPDNPAAWLQVAANRNALDACRRGRRQARLAARLTPPAAPGPGLDPTAGSASGPVSDERIPLLFACCHPGLAAEARLALTLRAVVGLTTAQIARAFLVNETALAQRIVRAKRKVVTAGISLTVPEPSELTARLADVLAVVYVMFNEGFVSSAGATMDRDLADDAVWLAEVVATSLPREAEAWGLAALLRLQHARAGARFNARGELVLLRDQDRSRWDRAAIAAAEEHLERAAALGAPGPYQLQAAIAACHAVAAWEDTDWLQIATLYDLLVRLDPSPVVRLNRALARAQLGPEHAAPALAEIEALGGTGPHPGVLQGYHLFHAARAALLETLGRTAEAEQANRRALSLTVNDAERRLLATRLHRHPFADGS